MAQLDPFSVKGVIVDTVLAEYYQADNLGAAGRGGAKIVSMVFVNTDVAAVTLNCSFKDFATGNEVPIIEKDYSIPAKGSLKVDYEICMNPSDRILLAASTANKVTYAFSVVEIPRA